MIGISENDLLSSIVVIILVFAGLLVLVGTIIVNEIHEARLMVLREFEAVKKDAAAQWKAHNQWLFTQLYNQTPGKVLKPDEIEPELTSEPAQVYSPTTDPMSEFTGLRDDFHGNS